MGKTKRGRRFALLLGLSLVALLAVFAWANLEKIRFVMDFENLGDNVQGYPEYRHRKTGIVFVDVDGFKREDVHRYDKAALGYSVEYNSEAGVRITIYVYDFGLKEIPTGPFSPIIRQQSLRARGDIYRAKEKGSYQDVKDMWSGIVMLGDNERAPLIRKLSFTLRRDDQDHRSELYLTGFKKHFLKIRVTFPSEKEAECHDDGQETTLENGLMSRSIRAGGVFRSQRLTDHRR